jgi:hypothetical protein
MAGAVVVSLVRPLAWALGLAGFLAGGGLLVVGGPILVLPTPAGVENALGAPVTSIAFGSPSTGLLLLIALGAAGLVILVLAATVAGAWTERNLIPVTLDGAADEGILAPLDVGTAPGTGRVAVIRLLGLVPVVVVALVAWPTLYAAAYHQLVLPDELVTPLPVRVLRDIPLPLAALAVTWLVSDAASAVGVRRLVLERRPVMAAFRLGWADLLRRPLRVLGTQVIGLSALAILLLPAMLAAMAGWVRVRAALADERDPLAVVATVVLWVAIWMGCLVLAGVGAAVRSAAWTLESARGV